MVKVLYLCIAQEHDLRLVFLAAFICVFDCLTGMNLFVRARDASGKRQFLFLSGAALVFATGVWATHFVAELAFRPGLPVAYDIDLTALSLGVAITLVWLGMGIALRFDRPVVGGALIGVAIGAMHYTGMAALRVPADLNWDIAYVATSVAVGAIGAAAAMRVVCLGSAWPYRAWAAGLLVLAICGLHFIGMAAITLTPDPLVATPTNVIAPELLAVLVGASTIGIVMLGMSASIFDEQSARRATREAEKLRRSEELLARAQRLAHMGSFVGDVAADHHEWSDENYRIFGVDRDFVPTLDKILSLVLPEDRPTVLAARKEIENGVCPAPFEHRIRRPDGEVRQIYRETELICDQNGKPMRVLGVLHDVTEARAAEARLRQTMGNLERAQRIAHMGSIAVDLTTDHVEWSDEMYRICGVDRDFDIAYGNFLKLLLPEDRQKLATIREQIAKGISPAASEYRIRRPDGEVRHIYRESELIRDESGQPVRWVGTLQDVTEERAAEARQKELEKQLLHSQKLEALGTLAGGIAHDLNNTLVPVLALSQMLMDTVAEADREDLQTIILATRRAKELVQQILAFSRKQEVQKTEVDPAGVVRQALQMLRATLPPNIVVIEEIDPVPPIFADAGQLQQVVVNLVTNAAQAIGSTSASITVAVCALAQTSAAECRDNFIRIRIADTGCGMEQEVVDRIFEPFFTTKGVGEGTGLGLSVVHGIVTGHGGTIEVASEPGKGTTFTILLPGSQPAALSLEAVAA